MKKLNQLVIRSFIGPFVMTFFISIFILLMQFLWKYIDDLVGKGLGWFLITKLMLYFSATMVPLALPMAILLSSLMTFGNLAEHFELAACKASGVSLQKVMRPLIILTCFISMVAFYFSNNILPIANLKMNALLYDVRQQKPSLYLKEGVFYNGIDGYSIRIGKKDNDGQTLRNVMIYDHSDQAGNTKLIMADKGKMVMSEDERYLILTLFNGNSYEEQQSARKKINTHPLIRSEFDEQTIRFDLSTFKMTRTNEQLFKDNYQMLNLRQLTVSSDSIVKKTEERRKDFQHYFFSMVVLPMDSVKKTAAVKLPFVLHNFIANFPPVQRREILSAALYGARNAKAVAYDAANDIKIRNKTVARHMIEWHRKFTLSIACLILFFIGAPLGAIIRKGGFGLPVVISILFFVTYHVISIMGEKTVREVVIPAYKGMWISTFILLPVGIFLTYKAATDSALFDKDSYTSIFKKVGTKKKENSVSAS
ncbi:MAG: LptF/LptG family permease [Bacteroidetes bacterium]|nr:LptF/LptG family permease [Bacteroidota bacterium]